MIPLRVLQIAAGPMGPDVLAAQSTAAALCSAGHASSLAGPGLEVPGALTYRTGWWPWITGERRRTVRLIARWMPDVLHLHGVNGLGAVLEISRQLGLGVVTSLTSTEDPHAARRLRDPRIGWTLVATEHLRAHALGRIGIQRDRLALIPPIPPLPVPRAERTPPWRLGIIATADPQTGNDLREVLDAVQEVQSSGLAVGALAHVAWLQGRRRTALAGQLEAAGAPIGPDDLAAFLAEVDAIALVGRRETPAVVVLAALAAGVPVLAPPIGGLPELIADGSQGLLVAQPTQASWASAIRQLHDHRRRQDMADAALQESTERFAAADATDALVALYRSSLGPDSGAAKAEVSQTWRRLSDARAR
jgi:hypothetical protein